MLGGVMRLSAGQSTALNLARGCAAQFVLIGHIAFLPPSFLIQDFGVILFFLLSGFLIAGTTLNKPENYSFANFVLDRGARIFVPYIPALAFLVAVGLLFRLDG